MPFTTFKSFEAQIINIRSIVATNDELRLKISNGEVTTSVCIDELYWRRYDYCSAILRLYASFERFVIDALQKWLDWVVKHKLPILSQSDRVITRYRHGVGEILKRSTESRFSKVNITSMVDGLAALQNKTDTPLGIEPVFAATPNLRFLEVVNALESLELLGASEWLNSFPPLQQCCEAADKTPEGYLKELVERRNEAAHGNKMPDDFWSVALIKECADFTLCLATAISEFIVSKMVEFTETLPKHCDNNLRLAQIGKVTENLKKHNAFIISSSTVGIWEGMEILVVTNSRCYIDLLKSIQLNGINTAVWMPSENEEIGLCADTLPPKKSRIFSFCGTNWL
ncbi:MAE_28990/MAE_18760 family HEPN-like nuclease [Pseudomonas yamanorum]